MVQYFGDFAEDDTVNIPFNTFTSNDPTASATITNLVDADIKVHKDGGLTQIVTDGATVIIDFDSITGNHLVTIDTSVHADYSTGSEYQVRIEGTTVDGGTINAWIGSFSIERAGGVLALIKAGNLSANVVQIGGVTQSATDLKDFADAGYDPVTNKVQGVVLVDTTTTNTDMRGTDNAALASVASEARLSELDAATAGKAANDISLILADTGTDGVVLANDAITAAKIATNALGALELAADAVNEIRDSIISDATAFAGANIATINGKLPAALVGGRMDSNISAVNNNNEAALDLERSARTIIRGAAVIGTLSTTQMTTDITVTVAEQFNGRIIIFASDTTTLALRNQATDITATAVAGGLLTFTALTTAPVSTDSFVIV